MRQGLRALSLTAPALIVYAVLLWLPLFFVVTLSLHAYASATGIQEHVWTLANYMRIATDSYYYSLFGRTLRLALVTTAACAVIGTLEALIISRMKAPWRTIFLIVALGPLLISVISRTLGWVLIFGNTGVLNEMLQAAGVTKAPIQFMYTEAAVVVALVHYLTPYMITAVWTSLQKVDRRIEDAAVSLGASPLTTMRRIVLPLVTPGIVSGGIIVFCLSASAFATPEIIGGGRYKIVPTEAYDLFLNRFNWPLGAALALLLLALTLTLTLVVDRVLERRATA